MLRVMTKRLKLTTLVGVNFMTALVDDPANGLRKSTEYLLNDAVMTGMHALVEASSSIESASVAAPGKDEYMHCIEPPL